MGEIAQGKVPGYFFDKVTLAELADDLLADYRINAKKSLERAECSVKKLKKHFEGMRATDIETPQINKYIEARKGKNAANATINRELAALKRMFNLGMVGRKVRRKPHIPRLDEDNVRKGFFEPHEFVALRKALPDFLKGFVTFAYLSGWRRSEITNLRWNQVDRSLEFVTLNPGETKNKAGRVLYLCGELREVIVRQWESRKESGKLCPYVFPNEQGIDKIKDFRRPWKNACGDAKIGDKRFHDFRRTAVRNLVRAGNAERVAMEISGHKSRSVFDRYNIVSDDDLRVAMEKQAAYLSGRTDAMGTKTGTIEEFPKKGDIASSL